MQCPFCGSDSQVLDSRTTTDAVRRRRNCNSCKRRFTTYEKLATPALKVHKRNGKSEPFDSDKIRRVIERVSRRRSSVRPADIKRVVRAIETDLLTEKAKSVPSSRITDLVLARLAELDRLAHDRMAANYLDESGQLRTGADPVPFDDEPAQRGLFDEE